MSSDYEFSDDDGDYYVDDEDMIDGTQDGQTMLDCSEVPESYIVYRIGSIRR
jgi:hypothetical protein